MTDILKEICDKKREHVDAVKSSISLSEQENRAKAASPTRGFLNALRTKRLNDEYGFICEIKKASPSKGLIRPEDFDPKVLAQAYERGGAACLSVLTDIPYFQGHDDYLVTARNSVKIPALRKDFMIDTYQVTEARGLGADCILLIMAALDDALAQDLEAAAFDYGMDVLIEVHNAEELERALKLRSKLLGINNRNLKTMDVSLDTTLSLARNLGDDYILVAESGLKTREDLAKCEELGAGCFLIGETFMRQKDVEAAVKALQK
ncbi:indole-3-glycerol phosphate synthase TrpC [Kordiimonas sp. SCSIO 12610]|uniref:indole-3-glycerol phosphate synthase TrpC n=1 Tax=Kordiimonas sp. SCSIO 12610 TaxID=2829597 RepID=UPI00210ABDE0|nr:indole-3-glycerol phosphate synthase TrpC [Kordiimonas sp. SCSIO 12610]UTW54040.1 indole-3-glycerol phosphate synthase TrpC [Kordiimonas sp. SCSIO 12610]